MAKKSSKKPKSGYYVLDKGGKAECLPELENADYKGTGKLKGKTALITGGDSGIGAAAAIAFAKEGANVAILYHSKQEDARLVCGRIEALGQKALALRGDVGSEAFAQNAVERTTKAFGAINVLVNNAGEQHPQQSILDITKQQLLRTFQTNIFGMFYMIKAALPHMPKGACIINTTSETAYLGNAELLDYSATKGAIVSLTRSLSQNKQILANKIRVNGVAPGPIWTPLIPGSFPESHVKKFGKDVPMKRPGQPYELAPAYVYLASDDSSYMSGQILHVNGGTILNG